MEKHPLPLMPMEISNLNLSKVKQNYHQRFKIHILVGEKTSSSNRGKLQNSSISLNKRKLIS